jgi:tetratricopeptide (TPR) repeat protein
MAEKGVNAVMSQFTNKELLQKLTKRHKGMALIDVEPYTYKSVSFVKNRYTYEFPDKKAKGTLIQWIIPSQGCYLVTFFYMIPEGKDVPSSEKVLTAAFDSFQLSEYKLEFARGITAYYKKDFKEALKHFDASIRIFDKDSWCWYYRGVTIQAIHGFDKIKDSSTSFARAATLDNTNIDALVELAGCFVAADNHKKAMEILEDALKQKPYSEDLLMKKAYLLKRMGQTPQAISVVRRVLSINKDNKKAQELLRVLEAK